MKIKVSKSEETIKKEEKLARIEATKKKSKVTNEELRDLLIDFYEEIRELKA